ncbi:MAG TPA: biopolymer transporter ExbD [Polyangia bacterium]|nr:biopolymer transporter ExbD [Polyangia bacterium]
MGFQVSGGGEEVLSEINVTPLVDVMLVLLVVFLVTAPLLTNTIRVNLPETSKVAASAPDQKKSVNVSVDAAGNFYIDRQPVPLASLEPQLKSLHASYRDVVVHLNADRAVNYGLVAKAMTAVDRAGITKLSVLTVSE